MFSSILLFFSVFNFSECYNILVVSPHPGRSHFNVFKPFLKTLAQKGHNLTVISYFPLEENIPNYRDVNLVGGAAILDNVIALERFNGVGRTEKYMAPVRISGYAERACEVSLKNKDFQNFLKEDVKFDAVLVEFFNTNCFVGLAKKYKAPLIGLSSCITMPWTSQWFGQPENPAYIPVIFMDYSDKMSFLERVENTVLLQLTKLSYTYLMDAPGNALSKKYLGIDLHENGVDFLYNSSLLLVNSHFSLNRPKPLAPSVIEVGGMHIGKQKKIPANIEKWINESSEGVIYFSLGSMIKGHTFPEEKRQAFLKAFGRLPQRVLWKWENDTMPGKPDNVMIQKWMPQFDILCHPNVKAFISHGGLLGMTEAVHCGVPVIVMPQYGDQHTNARALEANGGGVILQLTEATENKVYEALKQVLSPSFRQQAKDLSERFRDRPLPPLETAIYWVEYVARHKGAPHMRTAAVGMPFYQYYLLDVIGFLLAVALTFLYINYLIVKFFIRLLFGKSKKVKQS